MTKVVKKPAPKVAVKEVKQPVSVTAPHVTESKVATVSWRSIESAPKNEQVLVYAGNGVLMAIYENGNWWSMINGDHIIVTPTHWHRLPDPPK